MFFAPDGCTDEDIVKAKKEYLENGGDPDILFFVIEFVSAKKSAPQEANITNEENIDGDGDTLKTPKQIVQQRLDKTGFDNCLDWSAE